jgi:hypothetical protein
VPCSFMPIEDPRFETRHAAARFAEAACGAAD